MKWNMAMANRSTSGRITQGFNRLTTTRQLPEVRLLLVALAWIIPCHVILLTAGAGKTNVIAYAFGRCPATELAPSARNRK